MFAEGLTSEKWRIIAVFIGATLLGLISRHWTLCYLLGLAFYLIWHLRQFIKFEHWLIRKGSEGDAPLLLGIWNDLINHIFRLQKQHGRDKLRLEGVIRRFQETVEALPDATIVVGPHSEIRWSNPAALRYLGVRNPGDIGVRVANLVRDMRFVEFLNGGDFEGSVNIVSPVDETVHLNVRIVPYRDGDRLITARDVTELMRADAMRRDFVSNASHELKTPLTVMSGYMELLESTPELSEELLPIVRSSAEQTVRMRNLVDDLLTLSRLEAHHRAATEPVMVAAMLESLVEEAQQLSGERQHTLVLQADSSLVLEGSHQELVSAFSNLVFNAVHHTPDGTRIEVSWQRQAGNAVMRVRDYGQGIAPQHLGRLTERFYRVQAGRERDADSARKGRGTGLGLAICKHIVQAHGGQLEISSQLGSGSTFSCIFPIPD